MSGVLFDSDVIIEILRQRRREIVQSWTDLADSGEPTFYSPVSLAEIRHGMRKQEVEAIELFFDQTQCVSIGDEIGRRAGDYLRSFHASHGLMLGDALIAATASIHGLRLWTYNRKHFPMKDVRFHLLPGHQ